MTSITPAIALAPPLTPQVADMIGGKAAGLARLHAAGAHVPRWFVMTVIAFDEHVAQPQVQAVLAQGMAALAGCDPTSAAGREKIDEWSAKMQAAIRGAAVPAHHATTITNMLGELGPGPYAVRSSMLGEDSASHSFAGQLDSFLFRRDAAAVIEAVRNCQASAFSPRCLAYRLRSGLGATPPRVAVVVQRMIDGRISGVMFTAHPISGRRDHVMVAACPGLGEGIVSGACDTDEYVWSRDGGELSCTIATKQVQFVRADNDEGTHEVPVPEAQQRARCLTPDEVARIASEGARVAEAFGAPQDIEWTIAGDELFLLQARPITSLREDAGNETPGTSVPGAPGTDAGPRIVWDNSNIQESYCGVTTPLTFSFARAAYASVYEQTMRALGIAEPTIAAHAGMLRNMLGLHAGRVYYNINNWYRALLLLPSFGRNKADMEAMMGLDEPVDFVEDQRLSLLEKLRLLPGMLLTAARLLLAFRRLKSRDVEQFMQRFEAKIARVDRTTLSSLGVSALMDHVAFLQREVVGEWHVPIINDIFVMVATGRVRRLVERATGPGAARDAAVNALLGGEEGIESVEPTRWLMRLAREAGSDAALVRALRRDDITLDALRQDFAPFASRVSAYIERYGDRVMGELKLETRSLRDDPSFVFRVLRNFLDRPDLDADAQMRHERERRAEAEREMRGRLGGFAWRRLAHSLRNARQGIKARERMRLARTRLFGLFRDVYLAIGARLHAAGRLDSARDVFWLTTDELQEFCEGRATTTNLAALAAVRRAEFAAFESREMPDRFDTVGPAGFAQFVRPAREAADTSAATLRGTGCSAGVVEAELAVILRPDDDLAINGRILTTVRTDPGWAPLFPSAAGVLIERGSTLSHSAVLARELGIPAVVGVQNLLKIVRQGERVRLDGATGIVQRLDAAVGQ